MTREAPREVTNVDLGRGLRNLMERIAALTDRQRAMLDQLGEMRREMADIRAMLPEQTYYCPPLALPDGTVVCEGGQQLYGTGRSTSAIPTGSTIGCPRIAGSARISRAWASST